MAKELAKLFQELKEELKSEIKAFREATERNLRSEERGMRTDIEEMKESMNFISKSLDDANARLATTLSENSALKKENDMLHLKVETLQKELVDCQASLIKSEQYTRNRNIEIKGIAHKPNESLPEILEKIGVAVGEPISRSDVDVCHRVPTKDKSASNIIVQFQRRDKRDAVLEKAKKTRLTNATVGLLTASNEGSSTEPCERAIYINEHLCPFMKRLLGMAIARKRENRWKFVWTKNGSILARRTESSPIIPIHSESDLLKICAAEQTA